MKLRNNRSLRAIFSMAILLLFSFSLTFPSFHSLFHSDTHDHHISACSVENEEDACHQYIYHLNSDHECEHKGHLVESVEDCELCASLISHKATPVFANENFVYEGILSNQSTSLLVGDISFYLFNEDVRGPPNVDYI